MSETKLLIELSKEIFAIFLVFAKNNILGILINNTTLIRFSRQA